MFPYTMFTLQTSFKPSLNSKVRKTPRLLSKLHPRIRPLVKAWLCRGMVSWSKFWNWKFFSLFFLCKHVSFLKLYSGRFRAISLIILHTVQHDFTFWYKDRNAKKAPFYIRCSIIIYQMCSKWMTDQWTGKADPTDDKTDGICGNSRQENYFLQIVQMVPAHLIP